MSDSPSPPPAPSVCPACGAAAVADSVLCVACGASLDPALDTRASTGPLNPMRDHLGAFAPGQSLGERYTIVERAGAGGMGLIYKAIDRKLGRSVALKLIQAGVADRPGARERFRREIALAQQVTHPNVCRVHDLGEIDGQPFISMEYVEGQTLETLVRSMGHLSPSQTVALAKQIAAGLQAIHERGIVHRDLKPSNVMVDRLGHAVLMDFGMAYHEDQERLTQAGAVFGTLAYLAPEQARGKTDTRSDIYALGLILYETLAGRRPPGDEGAVPLALRAADEPCPPPSHFSPEVPESLDALVMRCLERQAEKRFGSARELVEVMQQFEGDLTRSGLFTRPMTAALGPQRSQRAWLVAGAALLVGALAFAGRGYLVRPGPPPAPTSVAFLPLSYSGPEDGAYLKNLLPLVLSQELAATPGLIVTPFAVSRTFGPDEDPRAVARQLGVTVVVKGEATPGSAGSTTIGIRALSAEGKETWSDTLSGPASDVLARTAELSRSLSRGLGLVPKAATQARSPEALKHYLEGLSLLEGWDVPQSDARAITAFQAALGLGQDFAEAQAGLSRAYLNDFNTRKDPGRVDLAEGAAKRAVSLATTLPEAHLALGLVQLARGRSAEAGAELERAQGLAPADDAICRAIGNAYARSGRGQDADRMFERAIALRPGYWYNHNAYGAHLLQTGRLAQAEGLFRKVIELRPESDAGYSNLGATLVMAGRPTQAEPFLLAALKIQPNEALHNNLGFAYYSSGHFDQAAQQWEAAIGFGNERAEHYSNLGDAYRQLAKRPEAERAYRRGIELWRARLAVDPEDVESRTFMAMSLAGRGECAEALAQVRQAKAFDTDLPYVAYYAGIAAALCDRQADAERLTLRAIDGGAIADVKTNPDLRAVARRPSVQARLESASRPPG